jgi:hypothetical protein
MERHSLPERIVAVGTVEGVGPLLRYDTSGRSTYPIWERVVRHSIRQKAANMELLTSGKVGMLEDPWPLVDSMLRGQSEVPAQYRSEIAAVGRTYAALRMRPSRQHAPWTGRRSSVRRMTRAAFARH